VAWGGNERSGMKIMIMIQCKWDFYSNFLDNKNELLLQRIGGFIHQLIHEKRIKINFE
jgi:hypothetical protein